MNLDEVFEDLETQFDAEMEKSKNNVEDSIDRLTATVQGNRVTLTNLSFGENYIAGLVGGKAIWRYQPHRSISTAKIFFGEPKQSEPIDQTSSELLTHTLGHRFVRYGLIGDGQQIRKGRVLRCTQGLIIFESTGEVHAVTIDRLAWLEIHAGDN